MHISALGVLSSRGIRLCVQTCFRLLSREDLASWLGGKLTALLGSSGMELTVGVHRPLEVEFRHGDMSSCSDVPDVMPVRAEDWRGGGRGDTEHPIGPDMEITDSV